MALQKQIQTVNRKFDNSHKQNWLKNSEIERKASHGTFKKANLG